MANLPATSAAATGEWFDGIAGWDRPRRAVAIGLGLLFAALAATVPLLWLFARPAKMQSSVEPPQWEWSRVRNGQAMRELEKHVKEASWVTFTMRGLFNEMLLRCGALESDPVVLGRDGWMFFRETLRRPDRIEETRESRRNVMRQVLAFVKAAGMELLAVPVPDSVTIYPEFLPARQQLPPGRERVYDEILADLAAAGVPTVDLRSLFLAQKAARPDVRLCYQRDTHWNLEGQMLAADAIARRIEQERWVDLTTAPWRTKVGQRRASPWVPGLVRMLGLRYEPGTPVAEASSLVQELAEQREWRDLSVFDEAGRDVTQTTERSGAVVALCGTSYSQSLSPELSAALGCAVDQRCVIGGGGSFRSLFTFAGLLGKEGFKPRVVVWEWVERDFLGEWTGKSSLFP